MSHLKAEMAKAALVHVPFDGWSDATLRAAASDLGITEALARIYAPRGGVDLALESHRLGDEALRSKATSMGLDSLRFREKISALVWERLQLAGDREVVRGATVLLSLPHYAPEGVKAVWGTVDLIWELAGDEAQDLNYYTKRLTLAGIYSATLLYWLGDDSEDQAETRAFLERRIANVMQIEKGKAALRANPLTRPLMAAQACFAGLIPAPRKGDQ